MKKTFLCFLFLLGMMFHAIAQDARFYVNMGDNMYDKEDYQGAIRAYSKGLEIFKDSDELYTSRADAKKQVKDYKGAIADFTQAIRIKPQNAPYYSLRADSKYKVADYNGAISDATKAIQLDSKQFNSYAIRGKSKLKLNDKSACDDFKVIGDETFDMWIGFDDIEKLYNSNCK